MTSGHLQRFLSFNPDRSMNLVVHFGRITFHVRVISVSDGDLVFKVKWSGYL